MGMYLQIDDGMEPLASNAGHADLCDWIDSLPVKENAELLHLREIGWSQNLADLESQLEAAIKSNPPPDDATTSTAEGLLKMLKARPDKSAVCSVTDGMGPDDGKDE